MSVYNLWDPNRIEPKLKSALSSDWSYASPVATPRSVSPPAKFGESIFNKYIELIKSKSNISTKAKQIEYPERPFDFYDDEEFAFGINLLKNNVSCVGDNMTKLIQMAQEPWPDNVKLFQPYEVEQILLPDNASCLAVQAFLKMCNLPFEVEMRWNAEFMSPSGRVPFIKCGAFVVSELESIVQFAANKGVTLCSKLSSEERAEMRAYMSLITNVLVNAELYISWLDEETFNAVTRIRNSSVYPWPLGWIQTRSKRGAVLKRLKALHWQGKTLDQVLADVEQCCNSLSQRLGDKDFFFGVPTPLDALVYGHMRALLSATGPKAGLMIKPITSSLLRHVLRISNLTMLKLLPQEEYLVSQGCQICSRRRIIETASRTKRSKMCIRNPSQDSIVYIKDVFGFKPFASKQVTILSSDGKLTCQYENKDSAWPVREEYEFIDDLIDEIIDKVYEIANDNLIVVDNDFEVITYQNERFNNVDRKCNDNLDIIEENESDVAVTIEIVGEDEIQVIDSIDDRLAEKLDSVTIIAQNIDDKELFIDADNSVASEGHITSLNDISVNSKESETSSRVMSTKSFYSRGCDSDTSLKIPSNDEISVESLLKYLRQRKAMHHAFLDVVDVD